MLIETKYEPSGVVWLNLPKPMKGVINSIIIHRNGRLQYNVRVDNVGSFTVDEEKLSPSREIAERNVDLSKGFLRSTQRTGMSCRQMRFQGKRGGEG